MEQPRLDPVCTSLQDYFLSTAVLPAPSQRPKCIARYSYLTTTEKEKNTKLRLSMTQLALAISVLTTVTSIVLFVPVLMSQSNINSGCVSSVAVFTNRVPNKVRKWPQMPSTDVDGRIALSSISIVMRAHCSSNTA